MKKEQGFSIKRVVIVTTSVAAALAVAFGCFEYWRNIELQIVKVTGRVTWNGSPITIGAVQTQHTADPFQPSIGAFDSEGRFDIMVINGHTDNNMQDLGREGDYRQPPLFWRNVAGKFDLLVPSQSSYFQTAHPGRGLATADIDNDLDMDVVCCHQDSAPELLRNDCSRPNDSIVLELSLIGDQTNRGAIGAVVECQLADRIIREQVLGGGSYLSSSDSRVVIVVPRSEFQDRKSIRITVKWNSGVTDEIEVPPLSGDFIIRGSDLFPVAE